jgi:hypothetical protein
MGFSDRVRIEGHVVALRKKSHKLRNDIETREIGISLDRLADYLEKQLRTMTHP